MSAALGVEQCCLRLIDLSQPIFDGCPNCPDDPLVRSEVIADHALAGWRVERLTLTSHTGSHIDAPLHKFAGGASVDQVPLERFVGLAVIADLRGAQPGQPFTSSMLSRKLGGELADKVILVATGWGEKRAQTDEWLRWPPYVSPEGAEWLVEQKVRAVGIDTYSVGGAQPEQNRLTHEILLQAGMWIVEDLRFPEEVFSAPQPISFWGLPIHLRGHSGAFCRPVLVLSQ